MNLFPWRRALRQKSVWFSLMTILTLGLVAVLAPWIAPQDPYEWGLAQSNLPPAWVHDPNYPGMPDHLLGTDRFGRDLLSRMIFGTRTAIFLSMSAVPLAALIGAFAGLIAGYKGGHVAPALMLFSDMVQSIPGIMFMVIIILIFRENMAPTWANGLFTLVVGFAAVSWVSLARQVRVHVLQLKAQTFVEAAISLGASPRQVMFGHLLPNVLHVILVWVINNIPGVILLEAVLGYVGVGVTAGVDGSEFTAVSWGGLFFTGRSILERNPLVTIIPSLCILLISMSFILLGDFLNSITRQEAE